MLEIEELEKVGKGMANRNRLKILLALNQEPGLCLVDLAEKTKISFRNASEHCRKLLAGGLISKKYRGQAVEHRLTPRGKAVLGFYRMIK